MRQGIKYNHTSLILEHRPVHILTIPKAALRLDKRVTSFTGFKGEKLDFIDNPGTYIVDIPMEYRYRHQMITAHFENEEKPK